MRLPFQLLTLQGLQVPLKAFEILHFTIFLVLQCISTSTEVPHYLKEKLQGDWQHM